MGRRGRKTKRVPRSVKQRSGRRSLKHRDTEELLPLTRRVAKQGAPPVEVTVWPEYWPGKPENPEI